MKEWTWKEGKWNNGGRAICKAESTANGLPSMIDRLNDLTYNKADPLEPAAQKLGVGNSK